MKNYKIPITWESIRYFDVDAENLEEAIKLALQQFFTIPDDDYLNDSFDIDHEGIKDNYKEDYDYNKILNEL